MNNHYRKLVEREGEAKANEHMKAIRKNRKAPSYFATLSKEEITAISSKGGKAKHAKNQEEEPGPTS